MLCFKASVGQQGELAWARSFRSFVSSLARSSPGWPSSVTRCRGSGSRSEVAASEVALGVPGAPMESASTCRTLRHMPSHIGPPHPRCPIREGPTCGRPAAPHVYGSDRPGACGRHEQPGPTAAHGCGARPGCPPEWSPGMSGGLRLPAVGRRRSQTPGGDGAGLGRAGLAGSTLLPTILSAERTWQCTGGAHGVSLKQSSTPRLGLDSQGCAAAPAPQGHPTQCSRPRLGHIAATGWRTLRSSS